jgi:hypothetical protein
MATAAARPPASYGSQARLSPEDRGGQTTQAEPGGSIAIGRPHPATSSSDRLPRNAASCGKAGNGKRLAGKSRRAPLSGRMSFGASPRAGSSRTATQGVRGGRLAARPARASCAARSQLLLWNGRHDAHIRRETAAGATRATQPYPLGPEERHPAQMGSVMGRRGKASTLLGRLQSYRRNK